MQELYESVNQRANTEFQSLSESLRASERTSETSTVRQRLPGEELDQAERLPDAGLRTTTTGIPSQLYQSVTSPQGGLPIFRKCFAFSWASSIAYLRPRAMFSLDRSSSGWEKRAADVGESGAVFESPNGVVEGAGDGAFGVGEASEGFDGPGVSLSIAAV